MNPMTHAESLKALFVEGADLDLTDRHAAQYALGLAGRIERNAQELIDSLVDGNDAMRAVADEPPFSDEPFAADIARTIAARKAREFKVGDRVRMVGMWDGYGTGVLRPKESWATSPFLVELDNTGNPRGYRWICCFGNTLEHADAIPVATPAEDEQMDEIEARQVEAAHPAPNFAPLDMVSFAGDLARNLGKGA